MNETETINTFKSKYKSGNKLDNTSRFRIIISGPDYCCKTYNYEGTKGYRVQIGENNFLEIPISMLLNLLNASVINHYIYNREIFSKLYGRQLQNHGCHVHVVGSFFVLSNLASKHGNNYLINHDSFHLNN